MMETQEEAVMSLEKAKAYLIELTDKLRVVKTTA